MTTNTVFNTPRLNDPRPFPRTARLAVRRTITDRSLDPALDYFLLDSEVLAAADRAVERFVTRIARCLRTWAGQLDAWIEAPANAAAASRRESEAASAGIRCRHGLAEVGEVLRDLRAKRERDYRADEIRAVLQHSLDAKTRVEVGTTGGARVCVDIEGVVTKLDKHCVWLSHDEPFGHKEGVWSSFSLNIVEYAEPAEVSKRLGAREESRRGARR